MPYISSYDVVRVARLNEPNRHFDGTEGVCRPPQIGDTGAIVYDDGSDSFQVESVNAEGLTVWLAEFHLSELERVDGQHVDLAKAGLLGILAQRVCSHDRAGAN